MTKTNSSLGGDRLLRARGVSAKVGLSVPTLYRRVAQGAFPRQARIGGAAVWSEREIDDWIAARLADRAA